MNKMQKGFTLIELMIVVAIIAILAAIAIPAYQDYTIRAQVSDGLSLASGSKTAVAEYYQNRGSYPTNNDLAGVATSVSIRGQFVSTTNISTGVISVTYGFNANTKILASTIALTPTDRGGSTEWDCSSGNIAPRYLPTQCR